MSSAEFSEWIEFYKLEPFGEEQKVFAKSMAEVLAMIYNRTLSFFKDDKPVKASDFLPKEKETAQTTAQMMQFANMLSAAGLGTIEEKR